MDCELRQEQASMLLDTELKPEDQAGLFRHLEGCPECRQFLDSMIRVRQAARNDQEAILASADGILGPVRAPAPAARGLRRWFAWSAGWRIPVPAAVGLGTILLVGGVLLGSRIAEGISSRGRLEASPAVVVVCGLPPVDVVGSSPGR